ncbi:hypothetical protein F5051DRAFT_502003 [Lentinula edodes]|nr:hypothetical protein F5051DRAFT_502003 [Lentinula edodes]
MSNFGHLLTLLTPVTTRSSVTWHPANPFLRLFRPFASHSQVQLNLLLEYQYLPPYILICLSYNNVNAACNCCGIFAVLLGVSSSPITLSPPYKLETQVPSWPYRSQIEDTRSRLALVRWTWKTDMPKWDSDSLRIHGGSSSRTFSGSVSKTENWAICIDIECFVATMNDNWTGVKHL